METNYINLISGVHIYQEILVALPRDPMVISTDILKLPPKKSGTLYKWPNVEETWKYLFPNKEYIEKHRSYDDAIHEALIIFELYKGNKWEPIIEKKFN